MQVIAGYKIAPVNIAFNHHEQTDRQRHIPAGEDRGDPISKR